MKKTLIFTTTAVLLLALVVWTVWSNTALELNTSTLICEGLPEAFDGFRIAHVSDLHNAEMGKDNQKLLTMLREEEPNLIAMTGDLVDSRRTDLDVALKFAKEAVKIAPCYYVSGNHEARIPEYDSLKAGLEAAGVIVLENEQIALERSGTSVTILGVDDPSFRADYLLGDAAAVMEAQLAEAAAEDDGYTVLLSHRPELFNVYVEHGINLVLSGHAHGGQFRLPLIGGLYAPNQGFFPTYDSGLYSENTTNMVVSRGIGNSLFPLRFNNRPELIVIELKHRKGEITP